MKKFMIVLLGILLSACSYTHSKASLGTHNLSKGVCKNIQVCMSDDQCETIKKEAMTQAECETVQGEFEPRVLKKGKRFFIF